MKIIELICKKSNEINECLFSCGSYYIGVYNRDNDLVNVYHPKNNEFIRVDDSNAFLFKESLSIIELICQVESLDYAKRLLPDYTKCKKFMEVY